MRNKVNYLIIFIITIILFVLLFQIHQFEVANLQIAGPTVNVAKHPVALWQKDGLYYAFLPAACKDNSKLISDLAKEIDDSSIIWMYSEHIPAVFIDTESGTAESINNDKNHREPGTITVLEPNGMVSLRQPLEYIKGRGNTSYREFEKNLIRLNL